MSLSGDVDVTHSQSVVTPWPSVTFGGAVVLAPRSVRGSSGPLRTTHSKSVVTPWPSATFGGAVVSDPRSVCVDQLVDFTLDVEGVIAHQRHRSVGFILGSDLPFEESIPLLNKSTKFKILINSFSNGINKNIDWKTKGMKAFQDTNRYNIFRSKANVRKQVVLSPNRSKPLTVGVRTLPMSAGIESAVKRWTTLLTGSSMP